MAEMIELRELARLEELINPRAMNAQEFRGRCRHNETLLALAVGGVILPLMPNGFRDRSGGHFDKPSLGRLSVHEISLEHRSQFGEKFFP